MSSHRDQDELDSTESSDKTVALALSKARIRRLEEWRKDIEDPKFGWSARIRELEDFRLATQTSHKTMIRWMSIAAGAFSILVDIVDRLIFNKI